MPRRPTLRTWEHFENALEEHGIQKVQIARYYGFPKQAMNNAVNTARRVTRPNSEAIWQAIDDIKRGVTVEGGER